MRRNDADGTAWWLSGTADLLYVSFRPAQRSTGRSACRRWPATCGTALIIISICVASVIVYPQPSAFVLSYPHQCTIGFVGVPRVPEDGKFELSSRERGPSVRSFARPVVEQHLEGDEGPLRPIPRRHTQGFLFGFWCFGDVWFSLRGMQVK